MENVIKDFPKKEYVEQLATKNEIVDLKNKTDQLPAFQQFVTKADIEDLKGKIAELATKADIEVLKEKIAGLATKDEFNKLKTKFEKNMTEVARYFSDTKKVKFPNFD